MQFYHDKGRSFKIEAALISTDSTYLKLNELISDEGFHFIEIEHGNLNTLLDFTSTMNF